MASTLVKSLVLGSAILASCLGAVAQIGDPAPDFTVTDTDGEEHHLYEYLEDGKLVVLDFFYTTCGPCIYYSPQANLAFEKYGCNVKDVVFLAIDYDDTNEDVIQYDDDNDIQYPSVSGLDGGGNGVVSAYDVLSFPRFYFIDSSKTIIDQVDPPTLAVFDDRFSNHGIPENDCDTSGEANSILESPIHQSSIHIWPNPANEFISISTGFKTDVSLQIRDMHGTLMQIHDHVVGEITIPTNTFSNGLYLLESKSSEHYSSSVIVVNH